MSAPFPISFLPPRIVAAVLAALPSLPLKMSARSWSRCSSSCGSHKSGGDAVPLLLSACAFSRTSRGDGGDVGNVREERQDGNIRERELHGHSDVNGCPIRNGGKWNGL